MELYDQHEQGERVRSWLKENLSAIITGVVIGLGLIFGYHQWQNYTVRQAYTAAELFHRAEQAQPGSAAAEAAYAQLRNDHARNGYAQLAALAQARQALADGDAAAARGHLEWALEQGKVPGIKAVIEMRLARLDLSEGQAEQALRRLDAIPAQDFPAEREELRGDALVALGRNEQALDAYRAAQTAGPADPSRLEMKLAEFGGGTDADSEAGA